jgi:pyridoxal phosphate phosphatase PHOSPHO2
MLNVDEIQNLENTFLTSDSWFEYNRILFNKFKENKISYNQIKEIIEKMELNEYIKDLFEFIRMNKNKFTSIIISGSLEIFIKWILEYNNFDDIFDDIFCNSSFIDDNNYISLIKKEKKNCNLCSYSICKAKVLEEYLINKSFAKTIYIGDGLIDYCASVLLKERDILFPRINYPLFNRLYVDNDVSKLNCKVVGWDNGIIIIEHLKKEMAASLVI